MEATMSDRAPTTWSRKKKDDAPRGVFRHSPSVWGIRYACGAGCEKHEERVGPLKSDAIRAYFDRRSRAHAEPGWCPRIERRLAQERARAAQMSERARVPFHEYADDYLAWAKPRHRSYTTTASQVKRLKAAFGARRLDEITTADAERFLTSLLDDLSQATVNRYRDRLSGMFRRALRLGLLSVNPITPLQKFKEAGGRDVYLTDEEENAVREALSVKYRTDFVVSLHTGLRWSEQMNLRWRDVDVLAGFLTVRQSKHGDSRRAPINSDARAALLDRAIERQRPDDGEELVFPGRPKQPDKFFPRAIERARQALIEAGKDASRLNGYTWHGNRHTFASRLAMKGVPDRTIMQLGGWRSERMVKRYSHLSADYLRVAVERIASGRVPQVGTDGTRRGPELRRNFDGNPANAIGVS
jgi:integrase